LEAIDLGGQAAEQFLLGIAWQESKLTARRQLGGGPALGLWQMEPATYDDCWTNFLNYRGQLAEAIEALLPPQIEASAAALELNDEFACAMARVKLLRCPGALPAFDDIEAQANYYKQYYNGPGAATVVQYLANWAIIAPSLQPWP
jgi:hypothetical protein